MKSFVMYAILLIFLVIIFIKKTRHLSQRVMWSSLSQSQGNFLISDNSGNLTSQSVSSILKNITDNITELRQKVDVISGKLTVAEREITERKTKSDSNYDLIQDIYSRLGNNITTSNTVRQQLDTKQSAGDYLRKGGFYNFAIRSVGGDGEMYNIDYWNKNGGQPGWVKNGRVSERDCSGRNHRCVQIG